MLHNALLSLKAKFSRRVYAVVLSVFVLLLAAAPTFAQSPTLTIDTDALFDQINVWVAALDDVIFLGIAIAIAIAVLTFIGQQILKAFRVAR